MNDNIIIHSNDQEFKNQPKEYQKEYKKVLKKISRDNPDAIKVNSDYYFKNENYKSEVDNLLSFKISDTIEYKNLDKKTKKKVKKSLVGYKEDEEKSKLFNSERKKSRLEKEFSKKKGRKERKLMSFLKGKMEENKTTGEDEGEFGDSFLLSDNESGAFFANLFLHGKKGKEWPGKKTYINNQEEQDEGTGKYITGVELEEATREIFNFIDTLTYTPIGKGLIPTHALLNLFMGDERYVKEYMLFNILPEFINNFGTNITDIIDYLNVYYMYKDLTQKYKNKKDGTQEEREQSNIELAAKDLFNKKLDAFRVLQYINPILYKN